MSLNQRDLDNDHAKLMLAIENPTGHEQEILTNLMERLELNDKPGDAWLPLGGGAVIDVNQGVGEALNHELLKQPGFWAIQHSTFTNNLWIWRAVCFTRSNGINYVRITFEELPVSDDRDAATWKVINTSIAPGIGPFPWNRVRKGVTDFLHAHLAQLQQQQCYVVETLENLNRSPRPENLNTDLTFASET